jgi:hypothetical protein
MRQPRSHYASVCVCVCVWAPNSTLQTAGRFSWNLVWTFTHRKSHHAVVVTSVVSLVRKQKRNIWGCSDSTATQVIWNFHIVVENYILPGYECKLQSSIRLVNFASDELESKAHWKNIRKWLSSYIFRNNAVIFPCTIWISEFKIYKILILPAYSFSLKFKISHSVKDAKRRFLGKPKSADDSSQRYKYFYNFIHKFQLTFHSKAHKTFLTPMYLA